MRTIIRRAGWLLLALLLVAVVVLASWEPFAAAPGAPPPAARYRAEILRDEFGVPYIRGKRDVDVAYGVARAHAEDDFKTLQDVMAMTRGRYGAIAGPDGASVDYIFHLLGARATARRHYAELPADTRALLDAYASGLNDYAAAHPREVALDRLFPVNGRDIAAGFALRQPFFFGLDKVLAALVAGEDLPREHGPSIPGPLPLGPDAAELGSNGFAIAPARSGDGVTRLVSNTHQPLRGGVAWYELRVESGEGWHFAGATFPGAPFPLLGHNEHLGWTNTVNTPDLIDVYKLEVDASGTRYRLDGKWLPLEQERVRLPVRFGPLTIPIWKTVNRSAHGPVIRNDHGFYAIRYAGIDRIGQIDTYYRLNKARDWREWRATLARRRVPSTNFVYADETGKIAYIYNALIPRRERGANWRGVLPGDRSRLIWTEYLPFDALPQIEDPASGFLFNSNNQPFVAAGPGSEISPAGFPPEMGIELKMTNRARRAVKLLSETSPIGRLQLERIKFDTGWERAGYVAEVLDGIAALDLSAEPRLAEAQRLLATWDLTSDGVGRADALALLVLRRPSSASYNGEERPPPRELLEEAVDHLDATFGELDPPVGDLLRLRQGKVDLPLDGGSDTLRAATFWDVAPDGRLSLRHGDSFILFAEWPNDGPVRSQSVMPFGAATTRERSRHYTDQMTLYIRHQLKPVHFASADAQAHAVTRELVGGGD